MDTFQLPQQVYDHITSVINAAVRKLAAELAAGHAIPDPKIAEEFLSAEEAAKFLKIKLNTVYAKVERGELPHYRSGKRKLLFSKKELADYISLRRGKTITDISGDADTYLLGQTKRSR